MISALTRRAEYACPHHRFIELLRQIVFRIVWKAIKQLIDRKTSRDEFETENTVDGHIEIATIRFDPEWVHIRTAGRWLPGCRLAFVQH
ncbi:MAG: hypothetical protein ACR2O4_17195, partial [Hyphomicrobiaceae bacterium]